MPSSPSLHHSGGVDLRGPGRRHILLRVGYGQEEVAAHLAALQEHEIQSPLSVLRVSSVRKFHEPDATDVPALTREASIWLSVQCWQ